MEDRRVPPDFGESHYYPQVPWAIMLMHDLQMDIQMPIMDGIQATKEIRRMEKMYGSLAPGTPISDAGHATPSEAASTDSKNPITPYRSSVIIVALTASSLQSDRVAALAAGCNDFLTKPVSLEWLNNKIIEWGSIKALQMWADLRPEVVKSIASGQVAKAQTIARKLHVPEGRATPVGGGTRSRSSSLSKTGFDSASSSMSPAGAIRNPRPPMVESFAQDSMPTPRPAPSPEIEPSAIDRPGAPTSLPDASDSAPTPPGPSVVVTEATPTVQEAREEMLKRAGAVPDLTEFPLPHQKPPSALSEAVVISHPEAESGPARADAEATAEAEATPTTLPPSEPVRAEALPTPEDTLVEPPSPPPMPGAMSQQLRERVPVGKDYAEKDGEERTNKEGSRGAQDRGEDDEMPTD
jgi:osomolarity two-component system response regulator SSK1